MRSSVLLLVLVSTVSAWQVPAGGRITTAVVRPQAAVCPAMFSGGKAAPKKRATKTVLKKPAAKKRAPSAVRTPVARKPVPKKPAVKKPAVRKPVPKKPTVRKPAVKKPAVRKPAVRKPAVRKPAVKKPGVRKPAARKPVAPRPGTVVWSGNGQPMVVPRNPARPTRPKPKPTPMLKSTRDDDFSPLPLLGVTAGVLLSNALASERAPPPPSVDANQVLAFTVLAGLATFVFTGNEKESASTPATAPADSPARERKRDRLRRMFRLRRKSAAAADAAPTETAQPADAPADGAAASTPRSRFGRFRARFFTKKT